MVSTCVAAGQLNRFSPEHFAQIRLSDPLKRKQLDKGLRHLAEEGTILLLYAPSLTGPVPIVGAVGRLQFEVLVDRLLREYNATVTLQTLPFHAACWVTGPESEIQDVIRFGERKLVEDADGHPMILFDNEWTLKRSRDQAKELVDHDVQPRQAPIRGR